MYKQFDTSAKLPNGHFSPGTKLSQPPANIFVATAGRTKEMFNITQYY